MTTAYKKTLEMAKQRFNVSLKDEDNDFRPTSNDRNNAMLKESQKFAQALRAVHKDLTDIEKVVTGGLETVRKVLITTLPRAYEDGPGGAFPEQRELSPVGGPGVHTDALAASTADARTRLRSEVLAPVAQWLDAYKVIKERNVKVEEVRLELDVKRRSFCAYKAKYLRGVAKERDPVQQEAIYFKAQTEEDKMNRLVQRYLEMEEEVYGALAALVNDSVYLRDYMFASMLILKRTFTGAVWAFSEAYPGLQVDDVPDAVLNAPKSEKPDINTRFGYLSPGGIGSQRTATNNGELDMPTVTISEPPKAKVA